MLAHHHLLIIGGDARYLEVIQRLAKENATIYLIGYEQLDYPQSQIHFTDLHTIDFALLDAILLPVSGTDEHGVIKLAPYTNKKLQLTETMIQQTRNDCVIYSGVSSSFLKRVTEATNRKLVCLFEQDDMAILNSIPTAEGALKIAIEETDITIHGANIIVLGFGRVGMTVARVFSSLGAHVKVCVRNRKDASRIKEMTMTPMYMDELVNEIPFCQIIINTIPSLVLNETIIAAMDSSSIIIDLASEPGGTDFTFAKEKGVKAIHALGLPGKTAPKTAGNLIADVLVDLLHD